MLYAFVSNVPEMKICMTCICMFCNFLCCTDKNERYNVAIRDHLWWPKGGRRMVMGCLNFIDLKPPTYIHQIYYESNTERVSTWFMKCCTCDWISGLILNGRHYFITTTSSLFSQVHQLSTMYFHSFISEIICVRAVADANHHHSKYLVGTTCIVRFFYSATRNSRTKLASHCT